MCLDLCLKLQRKQEKCAKKVIQVREPEINESCKTANVVNEK